MSPRCVDETVMTRPCSERRSPVRALRQDESAHVVDCEHHLQPFSDFLHVSVGTGLRC